MRGVRWVIHENSAGAINPKIMHWEYQTTFKCQAFEIFLVVRKAVRW